jgi:hypothetical protein
MWKLLLLVLVLVMCVGCGSMVATTTPSQSTIDSIKKDLAYFRKDDRCYAVSVFAGSQGVIGYYSITYIPCDDSIK